jgi:hypothetical protein
MIEQEQRAAVVRIAREWIGTPFIWNCHIKGTGGDCTFVSSVYEEAGVLTHVQLPKYTRRAAIDGANHYETVLDSVGAKIAANVGPGDLALFESLTIGRTHSAIIANWPDEIIHARLLVKGGKICCESSRTVPHKGVRFYTFW